MKTEGFETEIISKTDGMNVVSIGSFLNKKEATVRLKELRALEKQVWLLYY